MKNISIPILSTLLSVFFISCEDNSIPDHDKTRVQLVVKSSNLTTKSATIGNVTIDEFFINIDEIEFDLDDDSNSRFDDDDISIKGPWVVNLMAPNAFNGINVGSGLIPNELYDEIEMDIEVSNNSSIPQIYRRSAYISGTISGTPFEMWYDDDFDFEIEFDSMNAIELTGENLQLFLEFKIPILLQSLVNNGLGRATDGNGDGLIQIYENDPDGNKDLVDKLIDAIEDSLEVDDDSDDDDDDDDDDK